jgi:hypothetical protein
MISVKLFIRRSQKDNLENAALVPHGNRYKKGSQLEPRNQINADGRELTEGATEE